MLKTTTVLLISVIISINCTRLTIEFDDKEFLIIGEEIPK